VNIHPNKEGLSFFIKDVSERKKQEQRMEFISKASTEMTWEYDFARDEYLFDSKKFEELFGYATGPGPHTPSFWLDKIPATDLEAIMANRTYAIEHKYDFYLSEYRLKKANGLVAHVRARVYLVHNPEGKVVSLIGSMEDITMEKLSEKSLMESIESYRYLFDNAPLPTVIFDAETFGILDANRAMSTQYGYSKEELLSMTVLAVHPAEVQQSVRDIAAGRKPFTRVDVPLIEHIKKNGERILVEVSATHIHYKNKPAILATANDITEKIRLQEQITRAKVDRQKSITKATLEAQESERSELAKELHDNVNQILAAAKLYFENASSDPGQNNLFITKGTVLLQGAIEENRK
jgi:PAS domain S-box-containing protein